jgi:CHAT domain-containing protein/tetratricopeptide (TPR) repeat protein
MCAVTLFVVLVSVGDPAPAAQESPAERPDGRLTSALAARDFDAAERASEELIEAEASRRAPAELAAFLDELAQRFYATETPRGASQAARLLVRALSLLEELHGASHVALLEVIVRLADLYFEQGRFEESLGLDRRALEIRVSQPVVDPPELASAERNLGVSLTRLAYLREGEEHLLKAVSAAEGLDPPEPRGLAYALKELAENARVRGRHEEALTLLERAVRLAEENFAPDDPDRIEILISLSGIYRDLHRFAECQWRHRQAWEVFRSATTKSDLLRLSLLNNEAEIRRFQGDAAGAERFYREALDLTVQVLPEAHPWRATYLTQLALLLMERRRFSEAEPLLLEALSIRNRALRPDHPELAETYLELGELYGAAARKEEALDSFQTAIAIRERRLGVMHPEVAAVLVAQAEVVERDEARQELLDRAIAILRQTGAEPRTLARALSLRSRIAGQDQARYLTESLAIVERLRPEAGGSEWTRSRFLSRYLDDYNRRIALAVNAGDVETAFEYSEKRRARALLDQMASTSVELRAGIAPLDRRRLEQRESSLASSIAETRERLRILRAGEDQRETIAKLERELERLREEFVSLYEEIKNASPLWRGQSALPGGGTVGLSRFQEQVLGSRSAALVYVIGREGSHVLAVPPRGRSPEFHRLEIAEGDAPLLGVAAGPLTASTLAEVLAPSPMALNPALPEGLLADLASPPTLASRNRRLPRQLHALFHTLVPAAVWSELDGLDEVIVIPDGILFQFPFDALVIDPGEGNLEGARFWLDQGPPIRYGSSATFLANLEARPQGEPSTGPLAVSVSNPSYDPEKEASELPATGSSESGLRPLPATALETDALLRTFGSAQVAVLQGPNATEPHVRAALEGRPAFVHFGTHGLIDPSSAALFASLALSPPKEIRTTANDGWLELFEIYELPLGAELAVLSACSTRSGSAVAGEGVFALSRGFLGAGARRVIASLWPVEDESTAAVIGALFGNIEAAPAGRRTPYAHLLAAAKRSVRQRKEWSAPFFWAPFVIDGAR